MGSATYFSCNLGSIDFVQRDNRHPLPEVTILKQLGADFFIVYDHVIKLSSGADLQGRRVAKVFFVKVDQVGHKTLNFRTFKIGFRIRVSEVN